VRRLRRLLLSAAGIYALLCIAVWLFQRRMQYFPDTSDPAAPPGARDVTIESSGGVRLRAWYFAGDDPAVLVLHGNAGHRAHRLPYVRPGHATLLLDYRGYGGSSGAPTEDGLVDDGEAAAAWLAEQGHERIVYLGESIGCGVALSLAARRPPAGLVLQSGALDYGDIAQSAYPFLPAKWIMKDRFDNRDVAGRLEAPKLVVHGRRDRIVPLRFGRALFEQLAEPKRWLVVEDAGHNDLAGRYDAALDAFLADL